MTQFFGKYRGSVANNIDPLQQGRLQISVPAVLGEGRLSWAMPCVPYAGSGVGLFMIPPVGANLWIEFEGGNPDYPIWSGGFWADGELPTEATLPMIKLIKTDTATVKIDDTPGAGGVSIELLSGPKIAVNATGIIEIDNGMGGSIQISGPQVSVNDGALEVV